MDARRENVWLRRRPERRCEPGKRFPQVLISMTIFTKYVSTKRHIVPRTNTIRLRICNNSIQKFFESRETFVWGASSIRVQPERRAALGQSEISSRKTPRWQPRGRDTHSFRPLVQEEKVSFGEIYSSLYPRVNSVCPAAGGLRLTRI